MISVIIPVYNIEIIDLKDCMESLRKQALKNVEYIIVNDKSPVAGTIDLIQSYVDRDPRFCLINQESNYGVSVARNTGISASVGEYLMFIDADDWVDDDYFVNVEHKIKTEMNDSTDILILGSQFLIENNNSMDQLENINEIELEKDNITNLQRQVFQRDYFLKNINACSMIAKVYKREIFNDEKTRCIKGVKKEQDCIFSLYAYEICKKVKVVNISGYHYRMNPNSICHRYNKNIEQIYLNTLKEYKKFARFKGLDFMDFYYKKACGTWDTIFDIKYLHKECRMNIISKRREVINYLNHPTFKEAFSEVRLNGFSLVRRFQTNLLKRKLICLYILIVDSKKTIRKWKLNTMR